jgi:uroporphyrinogen decarboxylase
VAQGIHCGLNGSREKSMNSRQRLLTSLSHREPDHVPLDIGGSDVTGIHRDAYKRLAGYFGFSEVAPICEIVQQVALPEEALLQKLGVDTRPLFPNGPDNWQLSSKQSGRYKTFTDEWGVEWAMPGDDGLYFDMIAHPMSKFTQAGNLKGYQVPDPVNPGRFSRLKQSAEKIAATSQAAIVMMPPYGGMFESGFWLRGYKQFLVDLGSNPKMAEAILDMTLQFRLSYWAKALEVVGEFVDVVVEYDDLGSNTSLLISPQMYRKYLKPRHTELFSFIKNHSRASMFLHSCGAIYPLIPDFIETGVDILNPVQVSATNMGDGHKLKQEFGKDITFWGGGVNTQSILPRGSLKEIKEEVRRRIGEFAPGGGYVFAAVHNIQPDVPPENIVAMLEAWNEYGKY